MNFDDKSDTTLRAGVFFSELANRLVRSIPINEFHQIKHFQQLGLRTLRLALRSENGLFKIASSEAQTVRQLRPETKLIVIDSF